MMAEYIEREAAVESFMGEFPDAHYPSWYAEKLKELPTADVAEVRHGEWVDGHCTECGEEAMCSTFDEAIYDYDWEENLQYSHTETHVEYHLTDYCPNCGADMRGVEDGR
jgi:hypothetical protein